MLRSFDPPAQVLKTLLCLRIQEVELKKDVDDTAPKKKFMNNKEKKQNLSRMKRKVKAWCDQLRVPAVSLSSHVSVCVCVCVVEEGGGEAGEGAPGGRSFRKQREEDQTSESSWQI